MGFSARYVPRFHSVESILKENEQPALTISMLLMRRHEKDFIARKEAKYIEEMKKRHAEFTAALAASSLPSALAGDITAKMAAYQGDFLAMAEATLSLNGQTKTLSDAYSVMEPILVEAADRQESARRRLRQRASRCASRPSAWAGSRWPASSWR